jgi:hypothetical protein
MRLRQQWRSLLPVPLTLDLEILRVEPRRRLVGRADGDLAGTCTFSFAEQDDGTTLVGFRMDVSPTRWWMRLPVPFAGTVVRRVHGALMRSGERGLARLLAPAAAAAPEPEPLAA